MYSRFKYFAIVALHWLLRNVGRVRPAILRPDIIPKRVLLLNPTHIGDIVISTSLLGVLKSAYPNVEIGFATATWSQAVVHNHPLVAYTHTVDHWRMSRENLSFPEKLVRYYKTRRQAMREIRALKYDVAISLHPGSIDLLNLSWQARIPIRAAFTKSFWAPLATALAEYPDHEFFLHQGACQAELLRKLGIEERHFARRRSTLAPSDGRAIAEVSELLGVEDLSQNFYDVIHMGSGMPFKELPLAFWREMVALRSKSRVLIFTGRGDLESNNVAHVTAGLDNCINACGKLSWAGFVAAIRNADTLYGVDSVAGHVAAAVGTRCVVVYHGSAGVPRWRPESGNSIVWTNTVPCSPCYLSQGCAEMTCLKGITPSQVTGISYA